MRAAFLNSHGGPEVLRVGEIPAPSPRAEEAVVRIRAAALNHLDIFVREGLPNLKLRYPHVLGGDGAGIVEAVGADVTRVKPGDEVILHPGLSCRACEACLSGWESLCPQYQILGEHVSGTHAELVVVPAANLFPKPSALSFEQAAAVPLVFTTAWQMVVNRAKVRPGQLVVIHGAGSGVTSAAIQIAGLYGAEILVTSGHSEKLRRAAALGAHHCVNYKTQDFVAEVKKLRRGGADVVIDHVGRDFWEKNIRCLKWGGTLVTCGATSGGVAETDLRHLFFRQLSLLGSTMGSKADFPAILRLVATGRLSPIVDKVFRLDEIAEAHRHLEAQEQFGKVVLVP